MKQNQDYSGLSATPAYQNSFYGIEAPNHLQLEPSASFPPGLNSNNNMVSKVAAAHVPVVSRNNGTQFNPFQQYAARDRELNYGGNMSMGSANNSSIRFNGLPTTNGMNVESVDHLWQTDAHGSGQFNSRSQSSSTMYNSSVNIAAAMNPNPARNEFSMMNNRFHLGSTNDEFYREPSESNISNNSFLQFSSNSSSKERSASNEFAYGRYDMDQRFH